VGATRVKENNEPIENRKSKIENNLIRLRVILLFTGLSLIILITLLLFKNYKTNQPLLEFDIIKNGVDLQIEDLHLMGEEKGRKEWELDAISAEIIRSRNVTNLKDVKMTFFSVDRGPFYLVADEGIIYNSNNDVEIYGNISISSKEGHVLNTKRLKWLSSKREIKTDDFVEITGSNFKITGKGLISNLDLDIEIKKRVKATFMGVRIEKGS